VGEQTLESAAVDRPVRLRQAREAAGVHVAALAAALKVTPAKLEALEEGRYDELPDLTFARALASSACRHLGIDPAPVLAEFPRKTAPLLRGSDNEINAPFKPASEGPVASPLTWLSRPAMLGAIVLLLAALVVMFLPDMGSMGEGTAGGGESSAPTAPATPAGPQTPASPQGLPLFQPQAAPEGSGQDTVAPADTGAAGTAASPATAIPAPGSAAPTGEASATPASPAAAASTTPAVLQMEARQASWVEVTNGTGTVVLQRLLEPGERVDFSAAPPYSVVIGKASAVQVSVRGQVLDTKPMTRNEVARFQAK